MRSEGPTSPDRGDAPRRPDRQGVILVQPLVQGAETLPIRELNGLERLTPGGIADRWAAAASDQWALTLCQARVLRLVVAGCSREQIALHLGCSRANVHKHLEAIFEKVGINTTQQLVVKGYTEAIPVFEVACPARGTWL